MLGRFHQQPTPVDPHSFWARAWLLSLAVHGVVLSVIGTIHQPATHQPIDWTRAPEAVEYFDVYIPERIPPLIRPPPAESSPVERIGHISIPSFEQPAAIFVEGSLAAPQALSTAHPDPLLDGIAPMSTANPAYSEFTAPRVLFPTRPRDSRLHVGMPPLGMSRIGMDEPADRLKAALRAVPDSMAAQTRREATMGFSRLNGQLIYDGKLIMPTDGTLWQTTQMMTSAEVAVRDSIRAERVRIMRERADDARSGRQSQP